MDAFKAQLDRIQQQLGGLTASQKMLTASLVAIMVMTLLWWGRYAGQSEMVPLLPQDFAVDDISRIRQHLSSAHIAYRVDGSKVLVPVDRQDDAIASLAFAEVLPESTVDGFEAMSKQMTPWDPASKTDMLNKRGKEITLRQIISRFPGVKDARVLIEPGIGRRIGSAGGASASIAITMDDGGTGNRKLAQAAANFVAGTQVGLKPENVQVVIGGQQHQSDSLLGASGELGDLIVFHESRIERKIEGLYRDIEGLVAKVAVEIDHKTSQLQSKRFDKDNAISKEKTLDERLEETVAPGGLAAEPGLVPNAGMSLNESPRPTQSDSTRTSEERKTEFENYIGESVESVSTPAGGITVVGASVRVPRSYFVGAYKGRYPGQSEPEPTALQEYMDRSIEQMIKEVSRQTNLTEEGAVTVAIYDDVMPMLAATAAVPVNTVATTVSGHAKEIALGALAVISLFMVSTMVRKGSPAPAAAVMIEPKGTPHLSTGGELAGEAGEGGSMLDGMELDEDAVRAQQMLDQVSTMVQENPDAAANLVKRWLNRS